MLLVIFAAFVLPKFVQRAEPPTSKEDLAAALAAVALDDTTPVPEPQPAATAPAEVEAPSPLREEARFKAFFTSIDEQNFEAAGASFMELSPDLDPETRALLTAQMELAITAMTPKEKVTTTVAEASPASTDDPIAPVTPAADAPAPALVSAAAPVSAPEPTLDMVSYMASVQSGDFATARALLGKLPEKFDPATRTMLESTLATAEKNEAELAASRRQLLESQAQMTKLQQESITQMQASVKELTMATKAAREAVEETAKLRTEVETVKTTASAPPAVVPATPVVMPEPLSIAFAFDSTYLSDESKAKLEPVVAALNGEPSLSLQLRGHTDGRGAADYNALLAQARCEVVRDFLVSKGLEGKRLSVVSFGKSQADGSGKTADELRRVEVLFRAE
jgi:outer membrane protein OmpA-like peptidoglycan-associated protein